MASLSANKVSSQSQSPAQGLAFIVGLACLVGFCIDLAITSLPPQPFDIQWRINVLQQTGDRSIVLLFGMALVMFSMLNSRALAKQFALLCIMFGVAFSLSGFLVLRDSLKFQDMALNNISNQEAQVRTQIQNAQSDPASLGPEITPEVLQQASQELTQRVEIVKQNTKSGVLKVGVAGVGNLIVTGLALIAIGRYGTRVGRF
jgi:hypothetical protein